MAIRVYRYGCLAPTENGALVREQMRLAAVYRNTLVEIERGSRPLDTARRIASKGQLDALQIETLITCEPATDGRLSKGQLDALQIETD